MLIIISLMEQAVYADYKLQAPTISSDELARHPSGPIGRPRLKSERSRTNGNRRTPNANTLVWNVHYFCADAKIFIYTFRVTVHLFFGR